MEVFRHPKRENMIENALTLHWEKLSVKSLKCGVPISHEGNNMDFEFIYIVKLR